MQNGIHHRRAGARSGYPVTALVVLASCLWLTLPGASAFTLLSSNELVFANVDHAPMGICSTLNYGYKGSICGLGMSSGEIPNLSGGGGVIFALSSSAGLQVLPFLSSAASVSTNARYFPDTSVQRTLTPFTDEFSVAGGLSFTHYSPAWLMPDLNLATLSEKKRYFLPATWLVFTIKNTNSTPEDFYFGLPAAVTQKTFLNGAYQGFAFGEAALAVQAGTCELLSGAGLTAVFDGMKQGGVFHLNVPAGQTRTLLVAIAYYRKAIVDARTSSSYYYTLLYPSIDSVIDAAFAGFGDTQLRCQQMAAVMKGVGMNPYRQFLASHALHSFMADTACLVDPQGGVHWWEMEGHYNYINTFDLTVDHAYYDSLMQPWALRNVLDTFSGALPGTGYSYETPLYYPPPSGVAVSTHGFSFYHDMGAWPNSGTGPAYGAVMGQEELQSWIHSAGLYWSHTRDDAWLTNNQALLQKCLNSMLLRDNTNSAARDGVTKFVNANEITTFDDLDISLHNPAYSGRLAVKNWACYLALDAMFTQIGDVTDALTCENMAALAAQTIVNRWNTYQGSLGYLPALLNGSSTAATIPMIEGLAFPALMGLTNAIDRTGGPYAPMLQALANHTRAVLVSGKCLHATSGAWMMTSANLNTWQSKNYFCQYAAEVVLGIANDTVNGSVDQSHATIQIGDAPYQGWADQLDGSGANGFSGSDHYPRGITSALWWLTPTNNPPNPVATSAPGAPSVFFALATNQAVLLLWDGVSLATGYNLKRATVQGGPYTSITHASPGASYLDSAVTNGITYYYLLTATNQIGESLPSVEVAATPIPSVGTTLSAALSHAGLTISWPSNYVGWILQTNAVDLRDAAAWRDVPSSIATSQMTFPTGDPNVPTGYFRLRHP